MSGLGIYFGPQVISIVETKNKQPINNTQILQSVISTGKLLEEKVPEDVKIITLLKDELIKKKIETKETTLILSGKDLIIRSFEMPTLSREELATAVNFEAKKYIPFKIEELISDFQWRLNKPSRNIYVLFVGIKKETLEKYLNILDKVGLKINAIEYSAFSVLRLLKLARVRDKGVISVIEIDLTNNDDVNFVVLDNGFPLFSRDIIAIGRLQEDLNKPEEAHTQAILERLRREIVISLDYYARKLIGKNPNKIFFIMDPNYYKTYVSIFKDVGLETQFIDLNKCISKPTPFSLPFVKAYAGSLSEINVGIEIDLLSVLRESITKKISPEQLKPSILITRLKPHLKVATICLLMCIMVYLFGESRRLPLKKELNNIISKRPLVSKISPKAKYQELTTLLSIYKEKVNILNSFLKRKFYLTESLDAIPRLMPEGMWLEVISFKNKIEENKIELILEGLAHLNDSNKEVELVNAFLSKLKVAPTFVKYFNDMNIASLDRKQIGKDTLTYFVISCRNYKARN